MRSIKNYELRFRTFIKKSTLQIQQNKILIMSK